MKGHFNIRRKQMEDHFVNSINKDKVYLPVQVGLSLCRTD